MKTIHNSFCDEIEKITSEIKKFSSELYIVKHVNIPDITVVPLQLLNLYLYHAAVPKFLREKYCVTSGLIQLSLDMHDLVTNKKEINEIRVKNRQMSVLAGDYFSSICYLLMANENLSSGVRKLAFGISEITTAKMQLYNLNNNKNFNSVEEIFELVKIRESSLYTQFLNEMKSDELKSIWKFLIENIIVFYYLHEEIKSERIETDSFSFYLLNYYTNNQEIIEIGQAKSITEANIKIKLLYHKYNIKEKLEELLTSTYIDINNQIKYLNNRVLQNVLRNILNRCNTTEQMSDVLEKV